MTVSPFDSCIGWGGLFSKGEWSRQQCQQWLGATGRLFSKRWMVATEKTGRGLWPSWSQSSRLPCGQRRGGRLGWLVGAKPANIFPPNYTGQVAMMVSWSIKGNFQSRRENCSARPLLRGWSTLSQSWWELFYGNNFGSCAPEKPDLVKLVANQWLVRALYCAVLLDFLCNTAI